MSVSGRAALKGGFWGGRKIVPRLLGHPSNSGSSDKQLATESASCPNLQVAEVSHTSRKDLGLGLTISAEMLGVNTYWGIGVVEVVLSNVFVPFPNSGSISDSGAGHSSV